MFKVEPPEETVTRSFRFPKSLMDDMCELAQRDNASLNNFVIQCCKYAVSHHQNYLNKKDNEQ